MPKRLARPTIIRHSHFFEDDIEFIDEHYGPRSPRGLSVNEVLRNIVADAVKVARERMNEKNERARLIAKAQEPR